MIQDSRAPISSCKPQSSDFHVHQLAESAERTASAWSPSQEEQHTAGMEDAAKRAQPAGNGYSDSRCHESIPGLPCWKRNAPAGNTVARYRHANRVTTRCRHATRARAPILYAGRHEHTKLEECLPAAAAKSTPAPTTAPSRKPSTETRDSGEHEYPGGTG
jgi:hypothetical protein